MKKNKKCYHIFESDGGQCIKCGRTVSELMEEKRSELITEIKGEKTEKLDESPEIKKKLSYNIERTDVDMVMPARCHYIYKFTNNQWLENIDNMDYFGIDHNSIKQVVIDSLVCEFRHALNNVVFGDPAGKEYSPNLPERPLTRIIKEGTAGSCSNCHSTEKRKYIFFGKKIGCINPKCKNYYKK